MVAHASFEDGRAKLNDSRLAIKLSNDAAVFEAMKKANRKMTISQVATLVPHVTEKTVRRAIKDLEKQGFVLQYGVSSGSVLYGVVDQAVNVSEDTDKVIPLNGKLVNVETFVKAMVAPEVNPLVNDPEMNPLGASSTHAIRRRMAAIIATAGNPGYQSLVTRTRVELQMIQIELEYALGVIRAFNESPVWWDHYRDRIAPEVRKLQRDNPELYQLMQDYIKGGGK